ncbi:tRNA/rRNA methyltransferase [Bacteroidota bacterium]
MDYYFILVDPAVPENVGASARAIKTMGFANLRLINPCEYKEGKAQWVAHGSKEILENAEVFNCFDDAIKDLDFIVGTTSKKRRTNQDYYYPDHLKEVISNKVGSIAKVGIVFGREESGLSNEELKQCDLISSIRLIEPYPSLNLSQSVMLYAYELSQLKTKASRSRKTVEREGLHALKDKVTRILDIIEINQKINIEPRIMERLMMMGDDDIHLVHSICNSILEKHDK